MNEIKKLIESQNYPAQMKEVYSRDFIRNYVVNNPDFLAELQKAVLDSQRNEIERLRKCQHGLSMNFLSVTDILRNGHMRATHLQPFDGMIGNKKMEDNYNELILKLLPLINIDSESLPDPEKLEVVHLSSSK